MIPEKSHHGHQKSFLLKQIPCVHLFLIVIIFEKIIVFICYLFPCFFRNSETPVNNWSENNLYASYEYKCCQERSQLHHNTASKSSDQYRICCTHSHSYKMRLLLVFADCILHNDVFFSKQVSDNCCSHKDQRNTYRCNKCRFVCKLASNNTQ